MSQYIIISECLNRCTGEFGSEECNSIIQILPPVISGKVHSATSFSFKYGRVEVIAKVPKGDWIYPGNEIAQNSVLGINNTYTIIVIGDGMRD